MRGTVVNTPGYYYAISYWLSALVMILVHGCGEKRCVEICAWGVELYQYFYRYVFYRWNKADVFHASYGLCVFADAFVHQDGRRASMA